MKRDFAAIYRTETDPWGIGEASSSRCDRGHDLLLGEAAGASLRRA